MFLQFDTMNGKPVLISLLNITYVERCNDSRYTNITTADGKTLVVTGTFANVSNQIRDACKV